MNTPEYTHFAELAGAGRYTEAEALASTMLAAQASDWAFWKTQLGYVCFLNEQDDDAYFDRAPAHFDELVARCPDDSNARFWKAYVGLIVFSTHDSGRRELQTVVEMDPHHPYASVVLGGIPAEASEVVRHLEASLRTVPNNFRALRELARHLELLGRRDEARRTLETLIASEPCVETRYGVMNEYVNGVLNGSAHADWWKADARRSLSADG